jgi:hypothetical protein
MLKNVLSRDNWDNWDNWDNLLAIPSIISPLFFNMTGCFSNASVETTPRIPQPIHLSDDFDLNCSSILSGHFNKNIATINLYHERKLNCYSTNTNWGKNCSLFSLSIESIIFGIGV